MPIGCYAPWLRLRSTSASCTGRHSTPDASSASVISVLWHPSALTFSRTSVGVTACNEHDSPFGGVTSTTKWSPTCSITTVPSRNRPEVVASSPSDDRRLRLNHTRPECPLCARYAGRAPRSSRPVHQNPTRSGTRRLPQCGTVDARPVACISPGRDNVELEDVAFTRRSASGGRRSRTARRSPSGRSRSSWCPRSCSRSRRAGSRTRRDERALSVLLNVGLRRGRCSSWRAYS
jgi:hypothetical protein